MMEVMKRRQAKALGLKTYYNAKPCKNGHDSARKTVNAACIECSNTGTREWREKSQQKIADYNKKYKEFYRKECADKLRALKSKYYYANKEEILQKQKKYVRENKVKVLANGHNRRAKIRGSQDKFTGEDVERIKRDQKNKCAYCEIKLTKYHIDHIIPIARGGNNNRRNIQILCPTCNCRKNAKDPLDWAREIGKLL